MDISDVVNFIADKKLNRVRDRGDEIMAACPFHKGGRERHPSFSVSRMSGKWHCFTCGESGNSIHTLAAKLGLGGIADGIPKPVRVIKKTDFSLPLELLGVFDYAPKILLDTGFNKANLKAHNIGFDKRPEYMRCTFPVISKDGKLRLISGRAVEGVEPRYHIYTKDDLTDLYKCKYYEPEKKKYFWREDKIIPGEPIIIVEGFKACLRLAECGLNVCALMGTSLSRERCETLRKWNTPMIYLFLDNNPAGIHAVQRVNETLIRNGITNIRIAKYLTGEQPDDLTQEEIKYAIKNATNYPQFRSKRRLTCWKTFSRKGQLN